ncbi:beta-1,6-N-acetylglucosaminyltransferase [Clostridium estertheticum]|uniref:beta-1,6-N-acetylglucosaminyltransferase n=1 Tax=Clostridium estertheticum TaxID=238834 RepID=UPI0013E999F8|nr:beta-1,6-N-acetylglucosaminyltransferase [Clostridium estertheticum]MBZ9689221.1 beta-1,6-N-acetylglucosaminyltransferase [Clostridium estertheticum]
MDIAYCIICHKNTNILRTTIEILWQGIHVDKKANIEDFYEYTDKVHFMEERIDITWVSFSQIQATLLVLKEVAKKTYDYVCLLSGDCLPLKNSDEISEFLIKHKGKEFIGIQKKTDANELENNIKFEHSNLYLKRYKSVLESIKFKIQRHVGSPKINPGYKSLPSLYKGANWFCLGGELCNYILKYLQENSWYSAAFEKSFCGDEVFFQTIIMNSKYSDKIYNYNGGYDDNHIPLRYIDWNSGPEYPKILAEEDFINIKAVENQDCIFARKFMKI